jgi:hypothetical protein
MDIKKTSWHTARQIIARKKSKVQNLERDIRSEPSDYGILMQLLSF